MDAAGSRIESDLRGLISGEVRCDDVAAAMYARDASLYQFRPTGVVRPKSPADVAACVAYAVENQIALHARGSGSGPSGGSLGAGLVVDFAHGMNRILEVGDDFIRVQPGATFRAIDQRLATEGRMIGLGPAGRGPRTIGGAVAVDASGMRRMRYGAIHDHLVRIDCIAGDGAPRSFADPSRPPPDSSSGQELLADVAAVRRRFAEELVAASRPDCVDAVGFRLLEAATEEGAIDGRRLLCGSDGALALWTSLTLRTAPRPRARGVALIAFSSIEAAVESAPRVLAAGASACELLDRRHLSLARAERREAATLVPADAEAVLLVEQLADADREIVAWRQALQESLAGEPSVTALVAAASPREATRLWSLAEEVAAVLHASLGATRPTSFMEDLAVPPSRLPELLRSVQDVLREHQTIASLYAHVGHGVLHVRPFLDLASAADQAKLAPIADALAAAAWNCGGVICSEHGHGFSRSRYVERHFGPAYPALKEIKRLFDPHNILNPGRVVVDDPEPLARRLRAASGRTSPGDAAPRLYEPQLAWQPGELAAAADACNGCGACRTESPDKRMCPLFRAAPAEEASPRAKAILMQALLAGETPPETVAAAEFRAVADLCVHCHMCRVECPSRVNIPALMAEAKAAEVAANSLPWHETLLADLDALGTWGRRFRSLASWATDDGVARVLLERVLGLARGRKLPRFAARPFSRWAERERITRPTRRRSGKVLYFVDSYAEHFDPELGSALVKVLEHNRIAVYVPPRQAASGMAFVAVGAAERARRLAEKHVPMLAEAVRQGYDIVATEPSAVICIRHEYPRLVDDPEAALAAEHTFEACDYLWRLHGEGKLALDFRPLHYTAGYHQPCHSRALEVGSPAENLLRLIPGLTIERLEKGCSGMAGMYGVSSENYRTSLRIGRDLIRAMRDQNLQFGATECSACKVQMEQGVMKATVHPIKVLAAAYGLAPELEDRFTQRGEERFVT